MPVPNRSCQSVSSSDLNMSSMPCQESELHGDVDPLKYLELSDHPKYGQSESWSCKAPGNQCLKGSSLFQANCSDLMDVGTKSPSGSNSAGNRWLNILNIFIAINITIHIYIYNTHSLFPFAGNQDSARSTQIHPKRSSCRLRL